jgi:type VI secretion system Hcp family effector
MYYASPTVQKEEHMRVRALVAALVVCLVIPAAAFAQRNSNGLLAQASAQGIAAGATVDFGDGQAEIQAYSFGVDAVLATDGGGGAAAGKTKFQDFHFVKLVDKSSPKLYESCANGKHYATVTIISRKAGKGQQELLIVKMSDVLITSYSLSSGGDVPSESVSLNYAKIEFTVQ